MIELNHLHLGTSYQKALYLSYICQYLYQKEGTYDKWSHKLGLDKFDVYQGRVKSVDYLMIHADHYQILVINGTDIYKGIQESFDDLLISANILPKKGRNRRIYHRGYYNMAEEVVNDIDKRNLLTKNRELVIAGHSMGGAIAKIISGDFYLTDINVFTFGSPQVSMGGYRTKPTESHFHYVNHLDLIPSFPSRIYSDNVDVFYMADKNLTIGVPKKRSFFVSIYLLLKDVIKMKGKRGIFHPHAMTSYIKKLSRFNPDRGKA